MAVFYNAGETKIRPGVYQRYENVGLGNIVGSQDGIGAIGIQSSWGPLGKVVKNTLKRQLEETYGSGTYGSGYTVPAAAALFDGGCATVYTYRMGSGGTAASKNLTGAVPEGSSIAVEAKYPGTYPISVAVQTKLGDSSIKQFLVYANNTLVETFNFAADETAEGANLIAAAAGSEYVNVSTPSGGTTPTTIATLAVASGALSGGVNPTVTNASYSAAWAALEPYYYNVVTIDVDDDANMTLSLLLQAYLDTAYQMGKLGIAVVGQKTTVAFATRAANAKAFNDAKVVYLGGGWMNGQTSYDGVLGICFTAGVIASTPSNRGITHTTINGGTDLCESLTYSQYEDAILSGMLMVSMSPDGAIWYDSGIDTLTNPDETKEDDGWKKIRRVKVRFELFDRLDRQLSPKVGRISADTDGVADVVQTGQRVLDAMANNEGKLQPGATFYADPENPYTGDSAWFIIQADDIDSLEKIYLQYRFRYSQNA